MCMSSPRDDLLAGTPAMVLAGTDRPDQSHPEQGAGPPADRAGGSRATAAASDHHVVRPTLQSVSEPSADSARLVPAPSLGAARADRPVPASSAPRWQAPAAAGATSSCPAGGWAATTCGLARMIMVPDRPVLLRHVPLPGRAVIHPAASPRPYQLEPALVPRSDRAGWPRSPSSSTAAGHAAVASTRPDRGHRPALPGTG